MSQTNSYGTGCHMFQYYHFLSIYLTSRKRFSISTDLDVLNQIADLVHRYADTVNQIADILNQNVYLVNQTTIKP